VWAALRMAIESIRNLYSSISAKPELRKNYPEEKKYVNKRIISSTFIKLPQEELTIHHSINLRLEIKKYLKKEMGGTDGFVKMKIGEN